MRQDRSGIVNRHRVGDVVARRHHQRVAWPGIAAIIVQSDGAHPVVEIGQNAVVAGKRDAARHVFQAPGDSQAHP